MPLFSYSPDNAIPSRDQLYQRARIDLFPSQNPKDTMTLEELGDAFPYQGRVEELSQCMLLLNRLYEEVSMTYFFYLSLLLSIYLLMYLPIVQEESYDCK